MGLHIERRKNCSKTFQGSGRHGYTGPPNGLLAGYRACAERQSREGPPGGKYQYAKQLLSSSEIKLWRKRNMSTTLPMDKLKAFSKTGRQVLSAEFPLFSVNGKVVPLKLILVDETEISKAPSLTTINYIKHFAAEGDDYGTWGAKCSSSN